VNNILIIVLILLASSLVSCSNGPRDESKGKTAGEVMTEYSQTLSKAPDKARAAVQLEEKRNASQDEVVKELDRSGNQP